MKPTFKTLTPTQMKKVKAFAGHLSAFSQGIKEGQFLVAIKSHGGYFTKGDVMEVTKIDNDSSSAVWAKNLVTGNTNAFYVDNFGFIPQELLTPLEFSSHLVKIAAKELTDVQEELAEARTYAEKVTMLEEKERLLLSIVGK